VLLRPAAVVICVCALALAACGGGGDGTSEPAAPPPATTATAPSASPSTTASGTCTAESFPDQGADHVEELPPGFSYNSSPPTSGPHHPQWAPWGAYRSEVPEIHLVHNLEHGGIVVQVGDQVPEVVVDEAFDWYAGDPVGLVFAPLAELGDTIALTAWTQLLTCTGFDEAAWTAFRDEHRFEGPEAVPPERMEPGL
jgi:hypothetical protein